MPFMLDIELGDFGNPIIKLIVEKMAHMRIEEIEVLSSIIVANNIIIAMRLPGEMTPVRLNEGCLGKGLSVKVKTAMGSGIAGLIPFYSEFSKLYEGNPELANSFSLMLNDKLKQDEEQLAGLKKEFIEKNLVYDDISKLQLITKLKIPANGYEAKQIDVVAYVTSIELDRENQALITDVRPVTSDYDPAIIATQDASINRATSPRKISQLYPCSENFPERDKVVLEYRGLGTIIDHAVIAALATANMAINHGPDTANPYSDGLEEPWVAFIPSYNGEHPLYNSGTTDHLLVYLLPTVSNKVRFFNFMNENSYHYPYNKAWPKFESYPIDYFDVDRRRIPILVDFSLEDKVLEGKSTIFFADRQEREGVMKGAGR